MLTTKSCDGTPMNVAKRVAKVLPSKKKCLSSGRESHEFLVQNQFLRRLDVDGTAKTSVMLSEAQALAHGKTVEAITQCCLKHWKSLRQLGHYGPSIEHYVWHRAIIEKLERTFRQWHKDLAPRFEHLTQERISLATLANTEFVLVTPCAAHDAQNSFRWSLLGYVQDKVLLRDTYVSIESLRNSTGLIHKHIAEWTAARLRSRSQRGLDWVDLRRRLWHALGVDLETVEVLADTLEFEFIDGHIYVSVNTFGSPELIDLVTSALLSTWRFRKWSTSRWLTVGTSSRVLVAALLTGIEDLVDFIAQDPGSSLFYLNGFHRLAQDRRSFLVMAAMVSRVSECALQILSDCVR